MFSNSDFASRMFAAFAAVAITMTMLLSSYAVPTSTAFSGVLA